MIKNKLIILVGFIIITSCNNKRNSEVTGETPNQVQSDTLDYYSEYKAKITNLLNLTSLDTLRKDEFEIRLWTKVEMANGGDIYIIRKRNSKFEITNRFYVTNHVDTLFEVNNKISSLKIDSTWILSNDSSYISSTFINKLYGFRILDLPNQIDIDGFKPKVLDGNTFMVEYYIDRVYRFYWYNCPSCYPEFSECRNMNKILDLFNENLGLHIEEFSDNYKCCK